MLSTVAAHGGAVTSPFLGQEARNAAALRDSEQAMQDHLAWLQAQASSEALAATNSRLDRAWRAAAEQEREARALIAEMSDAAPKLDGEAVFRTEDHEKAFTETGRQLTNPEYDSIDWDGLVDEYHYEDYQAARTQLTESIKAKDEIAELQQAAEEGATNGDLEAINTELDQILETHPDLQARLTSPVSDPLPGVAVERSGFAAPSLAGSFAIAHEGTSPAPAEPASGPSTANDFEKLPDAPGF